MPRKPSIPKTFLLSQNLEQGKTLDCVSGFHYSANEFSQTLPRFSPGYEDMENMFYFFYKIIIFSLNKENDDIQSAYVYFNFFHETVNSHNLKTANHIAHVIFVLHSAVKTHLLTNQNAPTVQIILYTLMHYEGLNEMI